MNIEPTANKDEEMQKNLITAGIVTLCVAILSISIIGISGGFAMPLFAGIIGIVIAPIIALMSVYGVNMKTSQTLNVSTIHNGNEIASNTLELKSNSREKQTLIDFNTKGIVVNNLNDVHQQNRNV